MALGVCSNWANESGWYSGALLQTITDEAQSDESRSNECGEMQRALLKTCGFELHLRMSTK